MTTLNIFLADDVSFWLAWWQLINTSWTELTKTLPGPKLAACPSLKSTVPNELYLNFWIGDLVLLPTHGINGAKWLKFMFVFALAPTSCVWWMSLPHPMCPKSKMGSFSVKPNHALWLIYLSLSCHKMIDSIPSTLIPPLCLPVKVSALPLRKNERLLTTTCPVQRDYVRLFRPHYLPNRNLPSLFNHTLLPISPCTFPILPPFLFGSSPKQTLQRLHFSLYHHQIY